MKKHNLIAFKEYLTDVLVEMHNINNTKVLKALLNEFKTNKNVGTLHAIVENFKAVVSPDMVDTLISENQKLAKTIKVKELKPSLEQCNVQPTEFEDALNRILFERKTATNLQQYLESYSLVKNTLIENYNKHQQLKENTDRLKTLTESMDEATIELVTSILKTDMGTVLAEQVDETLTIVDKLIAEESDVNKKLEYYQVKDRLIESKNSPSYDRLNTIFELKRSLLSE